jgi:hypothetical protein
MSATVPNIEVTAAPSSAVELAPHFDHVFLTTDAETLKKIDECDLFTSEDFGRFWIKESESTLIGKYRATNIFGKNTIVEFFLDSTMPFKGVTVGLVLSFDHPGEAVVARTALEAQGIAFHAELVERTVAGKADPIPWYHLTRPDLGEDSPFTLFLSEIMPQYYNHLGAPIGEAGRQERFAYLDGLLKRPHKPEHMMRDVIGMTLRLTSERAARLQAILTLLGYDARQSNSVIRLRGPEAELVIHVDDLSVEGVLAVEMALADTAAITTGTIDFGPTSSIRFGQGNATWTFEPQEALVVP